MANSLKEQLPRRGAAAKRAPLPPKVAHRTGGVAEIAQDTEVIAEPDASNLDGAPSGVMAVSDVSADADSSETDVPSAAVVEPVVDVRPQAPMPRHAPARKRRDAEAEVVPAAVPVVPAQLQLDATADAFLREIEVEGIRMGKRVVNRSSAARFAIAQLMEQMTAQDVAKALLSQAPVTDARSGRGRKRL